MIVQKTSIIYRVVIFIYLPEEELNKSLSPFFL
jgi:hypothetical protein